MKEIAVAVKEKQKVLIFGEEDCMQNILSEVLISKKIQPLFASKETIGETHSLVPELILLDHTSAPLLDGDNLCAEIKMRFPTTPLIVLSAYPLSSFGCHDSHIDLFIPKPFDLGYFLNCVEGYLTAS